MKDATPRPCYNCGKTGPLSHIITVASWVTLNLSVCHEKASKTSGTTFRSSTPHQSSSPRSSITSNIKSVEEYEEVKEYTIFTLTTEAGSSLSQGSQ